MTPKVSNTVLYLYGISKAPAVSIPGLVGVDASAPVEPISLSGLVAWASPVAKIDFADNLAKNMENLDWLAAVSVRHQRVVSALAQQQPVLPARFGTVFVHEDSLKSHLQERKGTLESDLKRIGGADEWGVKVFGLPRKVEVPANPKSGKDYLSAKAALMRSRSGPAHDPDVDRFVESLRKIALDLSEGGSVSSGQRELEWHGSILLRRSERKKLEALLARFSREWQDRHRIECTGPWPAYSFVTREPANAGTKVD